MLHFNGSNMLTNLVDANCELTTTKNTTFFVAIASLAVVNSSGSFMRLQNFAILKKHICSSVGTEPSLVIACNILKYPKLTSKTVKYLLMAEVFQIF